MRKLLSALALGAALSAAPAHAQYPDRSVRLVVNSAPGGGADILARALADGLSQELGQPFVVDNRPGAGGNVAGSAVASAEATGYVLLLADSGILVINPSLYTKMPFDPAAAFAPVSQVASFPIVVAAHPQAGFKSLKELIEKAKGDPGRINYASTGIGSPQHLAAELLQTATGMKLNHVPYRGGAPALTDLIAGRIPVGFIGIPPTAPRVRGGELVGLGVTTRDRSELLPDVPTVAEAIGQSFEASVWFALVAPTGTPAEVIQRLNGATAKVIGSPAMREKLVNLGYAPQTGSPEQLRTFMTEDAARWKTAVEASGAKVD